MKKQIFLGSDNFEAIIREKCCYIDKTDLISKMFENKAGVYLFTRPRRFGKSLNMSMLRHFFSLNSDKSLFDGLKISENKELCEKYQNQYPVIFVTLKDISDSNFEQAYRDFARKIGFIAEEFNFLSKSDKLNDDEKKLYNQLKSLILGKIDDIRLETNLIKQSINILSRLLYKHYGKKTIVLIDEYDVPLNQAFSHGFYDKMIGLIRGFYDNAFKSNEYLELAVLTGCLRISKESIFTGLNNLVVYTVAESDYSNCFGFTVEEVKELFDYYGISERFDDAKKWYDGYRIGGYEIFTPWDILNFAQRAKNDINTRAASFWTDTSSNDIIENLLAIADEETKTDIENLISGGSITKKLNHNIVYNKLYSKIDNVWAIMLSAGYLTILDTDADGNSVLAIPNREIKEVYEDKINLWFKQNVRNQKDSLLKLQQAFLTGDAETVENLLNHFFKTTISVRDSMGDLNAKESFYHGVILGLLSGSNEYVVRSNREAGDGYYDICVLTTDEEIGIVLELKAAQNENMDKTCDNALKQIDDKRYAEIFDPEFIRHVYKYGIAFKRKRCKVKMATDN